MKPFPDVPMTNPPSTETPPSDHVEIDEDPDYATLFVTLPRRRSAVKKVGDDPSPCRNEPPR